MKSAGGLLAARFFWGQPASVPAFCKSTNQLRRQRGPAETPDPTDFFAARTFEKEENYRQQL